MMKKAFLTSLAALALTATSHAQFTFKTAEGKVLSSTTPPTHRVTFQRTPDGPRLPSEDVYLTWEKERVHVVIVQLKSAGGIRGIVEYYFYYDTFEEKNGYVKPNDIGVEYKHASPSESKYVPYNVYSPDADFGPAHSFGGMEEYVTIPFQDRATLDAFVAKLAEKKFDLALDLDYTPSSRLKIATYKYPTPADSDSPAPRPADTTAPEKPKTQDTGAPTPKPTPAPKVKEEVVVKLYNKSNNPIEVIVKQYPKSSGGTIFTINPRNSRRYTIRVGGEVRAKATGALLLTVTDKMDDTEQVIAK